MKLNLPDAIAGTLDNELNLALCEWLGWSEIEQSGTRLIGIAPNDTKAEGNYRFLPNHITAPESLGLVHEVESSIPDELRKLYQTQLFLAVNGIHPHALFQLSPEQREQGHWQFFRATARQRVIALLMIVKPELFQQP